MEKIDYQAEILCNRISKRFKHLKKWAKRSNISSFRIYDKDIPEIPLAIDFYEGFRADENTNFSEKFLVFYLYERPYEKDDTEENSWLQFLSCKVATLLEVSTNNIFLKIRKKQKGENQYEKENKNSVIIRVIEQGHLFLVNLSNYLDTGLFFDHRPLRKIVQEQAKKKSVLNLFCYTASFSVYAAKSGAKKVTSVDLSNTYLSWAKKNFELNGLSSSNEKYTFINSDVKSFLEKNNEKFDIIILDPPTFSNSKKTQNDLDINRDWSKFIELCLKCLTPDGVLYFSTNSKKLKFDTTLLPPDIIVKDITNATIPEDFKNKKIHKCWEIKNSIN